MVLVKRGVDSEGSYKNKLQETTRERRRTFRYTGTDLTQILDFLLRFRVFCNSVLNHLARFVDVGKLEIDQDSAVDLKVPENILRTRISLLNT